MGIFTFLKNAMAAWGDVHRYMELPLAQKDFVFYAENEDSWAHYTEIVVALTQQHDRTICYLTSSASDPILKDPPPRVQPFYVGDGASRTYLFQNLQAKVAILTMPDLETFHLKRSRRHPVTYVYLFHSLVSTHMIYREKAFDNFDVILCSGGHHQTEIRAREAKFGLPPKRLLAHGYGRLDSIALSANTRRLSRKTSAPLVLIAPSWGPHGLIETCGEKLVDELLAAGNRVTLRPHPMTWKKNRAQILSIERKHQHRTEFNIERDVSTHQSLVEADLMISDWSGAALEYAFALKKPVLFIDVPRKVNNPHYERLGIEPVEVTLRNHVGRLLPVAEVAKAATTVRDMLQDKTAYRQRIEAARDATVYNFGRSGTEGAKLLIQLLEEAPLARHGSKK